MSAAPNAAPRHREKILRPPHGGKEMPHQVRRKGIIMFCNGCNNNNTLWLIILIIILFGGGYNSGCCGNNCGCNNDCCNNNCSCC